MAGISRRDAVRAMGLGTAALSAGAAGEAAAQPVSGDPVLADGAIGLFAEAAATPPRIAAGVAQVRTVGHSANTVAASRVLARPELAGGARYAHRPGIDARFVAANPFLSFLSADGRGWELCEARHMPAMWGVVHSFTPPSRVIQTENSRRLQACMDYGAPIFLPSHVWLDPAIPIRYFKVGEGDTRISMIEGAGDAVCGFYAHMSDAHTHPLLTIPEGYVDGKDNKLYLIDPADGSRSIAPNQRSKGPAARKRIWSNFTISTGYGRYATACFGTNDVGSVITGVAFLSAHRGEMNPSAFNTTYNNCTLNGNYFLAHRTQAEIEEEFELSFGLLAGNHTIINNVTGFGYGTCVALAGAGSKIDGARLEVCEQAIQLGTADYRWESWNGTRWSASRVDFYGRTQAIATESNRWGVRVTGSSHSSNDSWIITGTMGAVPAIDGGAAHRRAPAAGVVFYAGVADNVSLRNSSISVSNTLYGALNIDGVNVQLENVSVAGPIYGLNSMLARPTNGSARAVRIVTGDSYDNIPDEARTISYDTQLRLKALQAIDMRGPLVPGRNLGGTALLRAGTSKVAVVFDGDVSAGSAAFSSPPTPSGSGNRTAAGRYYFATSLVGNGGETGTGYAMMPRSQAGAPDPDTIAYKGATIAAGQGVTMGFGAAPGKKRRVYMGTEKGWLTGYWELDGTETSFTWTGQPFARRGSLAQGGNTMTAASSTMPIAYSSAISTMTRAGGGSPGNRPAASLSTCALRRAPM